MRVLLELGACLEAADSHAHTPLHWAAACGQEGCLRVLLQRGASLTATDCNGLTAVALAAGKGQQACLHALLAAGASPMVVAHLDNSALHIAACNGSLPAIRCLAGVGVGLTTRNKQGRTPRQARWGHWRLGRVVGSMRESCLPFSATLLPCVALPSFAPTHPA